MKVVLSKRAGKYQMAASTSNWSFQNYFLFKVEECYNSPDESVKDETICRLKDVLQ